MRYRLLLALAVLVPGVGPASETGGRADLVGPARVIDGNHLEVAGRTVRLAGIRAPEPGTTCRMGERVYDCGHIAGTALKDLVFAVELRCTLVGGEGEGPPRARCRDPHGHSVNRNMVHTGWALAEGPHGRAFEPVEAAAREAGRGLWRGQDKAGF